jgi:hypothetical protein
MKHIKQLKFVMDHSNDVWIGQPSREPETKRPIQPALCASTMKHYFCMPDNGPVYATVSTKRPTKKRFKAECLEFRHDENGHTEVRPPRSNTEWEFVPTLHDLDNFLVQNGINREQSYFVYFEEDA